MSIVDHVGLKVTDFDRALALYEAALGALGIRLLTNFSVGKDRHAGFGDKHPTFWLSDGMTSRGTTHVAFRARSRAEVEAFHAIALSMGARDNGTPGLRAHYHPDYFGAFVLDFDGHNIEAVCHDPV